VGEYIYNPDGNLTMIQAGDASVSLASITASYAEAKTHISLVKGEALSTVELTTNCSLKHWAAASSTAIEASTLQTVLLDHLYMKNQSGSVVLINQLQTSSQASTLTL